MANTSWKHAAKRTRETYEVFGRGFWGTSNSSHGGGNEYHKARAKLIFGNILSLGLVNIGLMVGIKRQNERKQFWESHLRDKVRQYALMAKQNYNIDETAFIQYMAYKFGVMKKPEVTPKNDPQFGRAWHRFVADHRNELEQAGVAWWE